jgi:ribosomal-protein-serine acetyltransferase
MSVVLSDSVVTLRPLERADQDALYEAVRESIPELSRWLPWCHPGYAPAEAIAHIERSIQWWSDRSQCTFVILDATDGTYAGGIGLNHFDAQHRYANLGYWVRTARTKRGLASHAVRLAARFAFEQLGMVRVEIAAEPDNVASRRVAEKAGATLEGIARNRILTRGRAVPAALYSLIPEDLAVTAPPSPVVSGSSM